ncbi:hypothetical protein KEU06_13705 [Pseudaminobacter sp. 19-2017]|uniref:Uncharacterized protein n=1 Tax=Pseudaminobacter soli (ex Zhang et al. 2022) TaxID=2831468 RepID=A0A942DYD9_9HYPH|nr:hypothetical protein [Pseudaminobacter soli]MBS3649663.1 hypothetical protein [Pseudaminobacter soli]
MLHIGEGNGLREHAPVALEVPEFEIGQCVEGPFGPGIIEATGVLDDGTRVHRVWNVYDDVADHSYQEASQLTATKLGCETCRGCYFWTDQGCEARGKQQ